MEPSTSTASDPILFHPYHGENIQLSEGRQRALRRVSFEKGIVFSERPLQESECFFVSIETVEGGWAGHLRIGLTSIDPSTRPSNSVLSANSWFLSVSPFLVPFQNQRAASLPTEKGSLIGVYYDRELGFARLHVVLNGFEIIPDIHKIPLDKPLYAIVDVFGSTKEVRVVLPTARSPDRLSVLCSQLVNCLVREGLCTTKRLPAPLRDRLQHEQQHEEQERRVAPIRRTRTAEAGGI